MTKCPRCGYDNPEGAKYCINCGYKLARDEERLEGLGLLLIASGVYLLLAALFEPLLRYFPAVVLAYLITFVLGVVSGYMFYSGRVSWASLAVGVAAIAIGLVSSGWAFMVGLALKGIFGPGWVLFLIALVKLAADRRRIASTIKG